MRWNRPSHWRSLYSLAQVSIAARALISPMVVVPTWAGIHSGLGAGIHPRSLRRNPTRAMRAMVHASDCRDFGHYPLECRDFGVETLHLNPETSVCKGFTVFEAPCDWAMRFATKIATTSAKTQTPYWAKTVSVNAGCNIRHDHRHQHSQYIVNEIIIIIIIIINNHSTHKHRTHHNLWWICETSVMTTVIALRNLWWSWTI